MGQHSFQIPSCNTIIRKESFYPRTISDWNALPTDTATTKVLNPSRLTYLINLIKLFFTCTFILYSTLLFSVLKIKFKIGMCTKVAVSSVIDGGRKLVEVEVVNNGPKVFLFKFLSYLYKYMYAVQRIISHTQTLTYLAS